MFAKSNSETDALVANPPQGCQISIVVPTYNEALNIEPLIENIREAIPNLKWEALFVDDNSPDGTSEVVHSISQKDDRIRLILRVADRGLAKACIQGMLSSKGDYICVMDGDGQHGADTILKLFDTIRDRNLDIVSAARRLDENPTLAQLGSFRTKLSRIGNFFSSMIIRRNLKDPLTGFFMIERRAFLSLAPKLTAPGFKILLDILATGKSLKHDEIMFNFGERLGGESKLTPLIAWQFATYLVSRLTKGIVPPSLISFVLVGSAGVLVHLAVLYTSLAVNNNFFISQTFAALVAISGNFFLNNQLTFRVLRLRGLSLCFGYLKFLAISAVGLLANISIATIAYENAGHYAFLAALAGILLDTIWKFVVSSRIVWK